MQGCRRSWEDKLAKCVKILSVKDHNSAKICRTWIISPHTLLALWCNIPVNFHSNPCIDVGGVEKTNFDGMEWRKDGMTDKANTKCPLAILWRGHQNQIQDYGYRCCNRDHCSSSDAIRNDVILNQLQYNFSICSENFDSLLRHV